MNWFEANTLHIAPRKWADFLTLKLKSKMSFNCNYTLSQNEKVVVNRFYDITRLPMENFFEINNREDFIKNYEKNIEVYEEDMSEKVNSLNGYLNYLKNNS